jgi:hypothetical protein
MRNIKYTYFKRRYLSAKQRRKFKIWTVHLRTKGVHHLCLWREYNADYSYLNENAA